MLDGLYVSILILALDIPSDYSQHSTAKMTKDMTEVEAQPAPMDAEEPLKVQQKEIQEGVRVAQAVTLSWSKKSLILIYIW